MTQVRGEDVVLRLSPDTVPGAYTQGMYTPQEPVMSFIALIQKLRNGRNPILNLPRNFLACPIPDFTPMFHREIVYYIENLFCRHCGFK